MLEADAGGHTRRQSRSGREAQLLQPFTVIRVPGSKVTTNRERETHRFLSTAEWTSTICFQTLVNGDP